MLSIENLGVEIEGEDGKTFSPVRDVTFVAPANSVTAIVGESGSGKTLTALAIMRLLPPGRASISPGSRIVFNGRDLLALSPREMGLLRGKDLAMVFQDPGASLNPVLTIGRQISEPLIRHSGYARRQAWQRALELLDEVGIASPARRLNAYPHELSGGQQQRVMVAMAIACEPKLLIADEPTSALDVTVQRQILELILRIKDRHGLGILFISHDLAVVADVADRVVVMRRGQVVEQGAGKEVLSLPSHPYTRDLVAARERLARGEVRMGDDLPRHDASPSVSSPPEIRLEVRNLRKDYWMRSGFRRREAVPAVKDVSFDLVRGETLGVVGESGSGKTTLAMMLLRLVDPSGGTIVLDGRGIHDLSARAFRPMRRRIQIVFQNPYASLNPRWKIRRTLITPMRLHGLGADDEEREARAAHLLERVGLPRPVLEKYPDQFSGGERQRIAIARCLAVGPEILICDECVSALDVSTQVRVLDLLRELQREYKMSYVFIAHDLSTVRYIADRILVFHNGEVVEEAATEALFGSQRHPYTKRLLAAMPTWPAGTA